MDTDTAQLLKCIHIAVSTVGKVSKNKKNDAFRGSSSRYADLNQIIATYRDELFVQGVVMHSTVFTDAVTTRLTHVESGAYLESSFPIPSHKTVGGLSEDRKSKNPREPIMVPWHDAPLTAQEIKGTITYGIRTNLLSLLMIEQEDDDGNAASGVISNTADDTDW